MSPITMPEDNSILLMMKLSGILFFSSKILIIHNKLLFLLYFIIKGKDLLYFDVLIRYKFLSDFDCGMNHLEDSVGWLAADPAYVSTKHQEDKVE